MFANNNYISLKAIYSHSFNNNEILNYYLLLDCFCSQHIEDTEKKPLQCVKYKNGSGAVKLIGHL